VTITVPAMDCVTKDRASVRVEAVVRLHVLDAVRAGGGATDDQPTISQLTETYLRSVIGRAELNDLVTSREPIGAVSELIDGPQDAPLPVRRPAAPGGPALPDSPQDAVTAVVTNEPVAESAEPSVVVVDSALAKGRGTAIALRDFAARRLTPLTNSGRGGSSGAPGVDSTREEAGSRETSVLDSVLRPVRGPAYLGGRDDDVYLRGWDDAFDGARRGNRTNLPCWGSAAYMTGWNDAERAIAKARVAESLLRGVA
jgi:hypothetical protein